MCPSLDNENPLSLSQDFDPDFEDKLTTTVAILLRRGVTKDEIIARLDELGARDRITKYRLAFDHWTRCGFTFNTARALASVLHGQDNDVRQWAKGVMQRETNLRLADMI